MKKLLLGALLLLSAVTMADMTPRQEAELDKLTEIFYPDTNMRADRRDFKRLQTDSYNDIVEMRDSGAVGISSEAFNNMWEEIDGNFPGDFIQQKREINKALVGYKTANEIRNQEAEKEAEVRRALNKEAAEDIIEIKEEQHLVPQEIMEKIITEAETAHPDDHIAQKEEIENKIKAYEDMMQYFDLKSPRN